MAIELLEAAVIRAEGHGRSNVLIKDVKPSEARNAALEPNLVDDLRITRSLSSSGSAGV